MNSNYTTGGKFNSNYASFLIISLLLHVLLFFVLNLNLPNINQNPLEKEIQILLTPEIEKNMRKVMVSPSDIPETTKEVESNFLADKNTSVEKQQIKRGMPETKPAQMLPPKITQPPVSSKFSKNEVVKKEDKSERLNTSNRTEAPTSNKNILAAISESTFAALQQNQRKETQSTGEPNDQKATDFAESRLDSFAGMAGNPDLLTGVQDGEITLLNAKADRFAVFVRRVALRVFSALRTSNWYEVGNLRSGFETEEINIRAVLDKNGKFLSYEILKSSKTPLFDRVLVNSVKKGAWDRNPPQSALAADGTIKFIFQSKAWVRGGANGRSRQWILLSTGLE